MIIIIDLYSNIVLYRGNMQEACEWLDKHFIDYMYNDTAWQDGDEIWYVERVRG